MTTTAAARRTALPPPSNAALIRARPALALIGVGAVAVILLWWSDTNTNQGLADWLTNAGRITGLLAGYAIVVLLALMARIPALERGVGTDRLVRWHAKGGRYTVSLSVAHTLLIIWGYAVSAHKNVFSETSTLVLTYPDVLMATVAVLLLVAVGVVSARAARRRLSYETWHFIHLYTYIALALAFSHQFATGADFVSNFLARVLWSALYIVVGALLLWFRLITPIYRAYRHQLQVYGVYPESANTVSVYLTGAHVAEMGAQPGQFFRWRFLTRDLWWAANPYSLSAVPYNNQLRITVKTTGSHSAALRHLRPGTRVLAEGPYGAFTADRRTRRKVLLIGGGVGITPLRALFETLSGRPGDISMIYRANTPEDLILRSELDTIAGRRGARVHYVMGPPPRPGGQDPLSANRLRQLIPGLRDYDVYVCGPAGMADSVMASLHQAGVPRRHIHNESFTF